MSFRSPWLHAKRFLRGTVIGFALLATGCSPLYVLDLTVPSEGYEVRTGIAYGTLPRQKLDIYRPRATADPSRPVIVFFYGGSWKSGARDQYRFVGEAFARRGYTVVIPDYRLYPDVTFPAFMADAAAAIAWTARQEAAPIVLMGHSAGAHIAALAAVDDRYLAQAGLSPAHLCGIVGLAGPYAFDPRAYRSTRAVFAGLEDIDRARPVAQVRAKAPPFLLLHGAADGTVRPSNSADFANALRAKGTDVTTVTLPAIGHSRILLALASPFEDIAPVHDRIDGFLARRTCPSIETAGETAGQ